MANLIPFKGVLYNPALVHDMAKVMAPPYDVIDGTFQKVLHERHPNNVIRLELGLDQPEDGPSSNRYTRAADCLHAWLKQGVLRRDREPAIYPYTIEYAPPSSEPGADRLVMKGFLSTVELAEFGAGHIYPHENTRSAAKTDRLNLIETCRANFSPIFSLFSDPDGGMLTLIEKSVNLDRPRVDVRDEAGFRHRLWSVTDHRVLQEIVTVMQPKPLFIADGHHRYETALAYRKLRRQQAGLPPTGSLRPYDSVLMLLASMEDPGLTVLPTHRVLTVPLPSLATIKERLHDDFKIEEFPFQTDTEPEVRRQFLRILQSRGQNRHAFGLASQGREAYVLLTLRSVHRIAGGTSPRDRLDVSILHNQVLAALLPSKSYEQAILYTKDDDEALDFVRQGRAHAALLLNPTKVSEVRDVAAAGERMPHKSTYFFPKPFTGLVINLLD